MGLLLQFASQPAETGSATHRFNRLNHSHEIFGVGFRHAVTVSLGAGGFPADPPTPEPWQIGYIQNVLSERITARYDSGEEESFSHGALLDAARPGSQTWIYSKGFAVTNPSGVELRGFADFIYGGGQGPANLRLAMEDSPFHSYYNVYGGGAGGDQLRQLTDTIRFGLWIAAKRAPDPPNVVSSYKVLARAEFAFITTLTITGHNSLFAPGNTPHSRALVTGPSAVRQPEIQEHRSGFTFNSRLRPETVNVYRTHGPPPSTVSDPTANSALPALINASGICPQFSLWD